MSLQGQTVEKFSIDSGGASASAGNIQVVYTIGEVAVQESSVGRVILSEGFLNQLLIIKIDPKIFLQGPYNTGITMLTHFVALVSFPLQAPMLM